MAQKEGSIPRSLSSIPQHQIQLETKSSFNSMVHIYELLQNQQNFHCLTEKAVKLAHSRFKSSNA